MGEDEGKEEKCGERWRREGLLGNRGNWEKEIRREEEGREMGDEQYCACTEEHTEKRRRAKGGTQGQRE